MSRVSPAAFAVCVSGSRETYAFDGLSEDVLTALNGAKDALVELGARLVPVDFPSIADATTAWLHLCLGEVAIAHEATYPSRAAEYGPGLGGVLEAAGKISATELGKAHILRDRFAGQVAEAFQDIDVLLIPVMEYADAQRRRMDGDGEGRYRASVALLGTVQFDRDAGAYDERRL